MKTIKSLTALDGTVIRVKRDAEWDEYQVQVSGSPDATYHTDDKDDALGTAKVMLADLDKRAAAQGARA